MSYPQLGAIYIAVFFVGVFGVLVWYFISGDAGPFASSPRRQVGVTSVTAARFSL